MELRWAEIQGDSINQNNFRINYGATLSGIEFINVIGGFDNHQKPQTPADQLCSWIYICTFSLDETMIIITYYREKDIIVIEQQLPVPVHPLIISIKNKLPGPANAI